MTPLHRVFLCAVVIVLVITAGCTSPNTSGASPMYTLAETPAATPLPTAPVAATTSPPGAAGTQPTGTCTADTSSDPANCGGCGYACPANALCQQGQCYCGEGYAAANNQCVIVPNEDTVTGNGCPDGMSPCPDGYCYDLATAADNCGICGNTCPAGMICSASTCSNAPAEVTTEPTTAVTTEVSASPSGTGTGTGVHTFACLGKGLTNCAGSCVNLQTSASNCGACKSSCVMTKYPSCCGGKCVNLKTDLSNCGTCGTVCTGLSPVCENGLCKNKVVIGSGLSKTKISPSIAQLNPDLIVGPVVGPGGL